MVTRTRTLHMTITGDAITEQCRRMWATEKNPDGAMRVLSAAAPHLDEATKMDIVLGKKKISGENSKCFIEEDDSITDLNGMRLLSLAEMFSEQKAKTIKLDDENKDLRDQNREMCFIVDKVKEEEREEEEKEQFRKDTKLMGLGASSMMAMIPGFAAAQEAILNPETGKPKADPKLEGKNGWITPAGKFFPCKFMGHVNLADRLGMTEADIEKSHVKVQDSKDPNAMIKRFDDDFPHIPSRGVTQAQFNTMDKWCAKHGRKMPENIEVR